MVTSALLEEALEEGEEGGKEGKVGNVGNVDSRERVGAAKMEKELASSSSSVERNIIFESFSLSKFSKWLILKV